MYERIQIVKYKMQILAMLDEFEEVLHSYDNLSEEARNYLCDFYYREIERLRNELNNIDIDEDVDYVPDENYLEDVEQPKIIDPVKKNFFNDIARNFRKRQTMNRNALLKSEESLLKEHSEYLNFIYNSIIYDNQTVKLLLNELHNYIAKLSGRDDHKYDLQTKLSEYLLSEYGVIYSGQADKKKREKVEIDENYGEKVNGDSIIINYPPYNDYEMFAHFLQEQLGNQISLTYITSDGNEYTQSTMNPVLSDDITKIKISGLKDSQRIAKSSVTSSYIPPVWDTQRLIIDIIQNHLPSDSKGPAKIEFMTGDGAWHNLQEMSNYKDYEILKVRVSDEGIGYSPKNLTLLLSDKKSTDSIGKFGEGLKVGVSAALKKGYDVELQSRDWKAVPFFSADEDKVLQYIITRGDNINEGKQTGSSTTFSNLDSDAIEVFRNIDKYVLYFSDQKPIFESPFADILDLNQGTSKQIGEGIYEERPAERGKVYLKGLLIPSNRDVMYSYNFKEFEIENRDRNEISHWLLVDLVAKTISNISDKEIIKDYLDRAAKAVNESKLPVEFVAETRRFMAWKESELSLTWIETFREVFGEKTAVCSSQNMNPNAIHNAQHLGLKMVVLPDEVAKMISSLRGPNQEQVTSYEEELSKAINNARTIPESELTDDEKTAIDFLLNEVAQYLPKENGEPKVKKINVYDYDDLYVGTQADGFASQGDTVNISRDTFKNILRLFEVFFHESTHAYTGAEDPAKEFRDFLTTLIAKWVAKERFPELTKKLKSFISEKRYTVPIEEPPGGWADELNESEPVLEQIPVKRGKDYEGTENVGVDDEGGNIDFAVQNDEVKDKEAFENAAIIPMEDLLLETDTTQDELKTFTNEIRAQEEIDEKVRMKIEKKVKELEDSGIGWGTIKRVLNKMERRGER